MAIFHFAVKSLSRGKGHSASAAAAYRAGIALEDPSTGLRHDYTRRAGVVSVDMLAPDGAPAWAQDPAQLWANVETHETRKNARVAREVVIALPHELDAEQRRDLARDVGRLLVERYSVAVQIAIHAPDKGGDDRNHHAHLLMTPRTVGPEGFGAYAAKAYDDFKAGPEEIKAMRAEVAGRFNQALERAGLAARVDHRPLLAQKAEAAQKNDFAQVVALDRPATKHEGKAVTQARRRGERLPRAQRNDRVRQASQSRADAHAERFEVLKTQAAAEGRLAHVDEQALHAQALLERRKESAARLRAAAQPSPNEAPRHDRVPTNPQRRRAPALTRNSVDALRVRNPGTGDERVPALRPLHSLNPSLATGGRRAPEAAGFSRVLRPDAPRYRDLRPAVLRIPAQALTPKAGAAVQARAQRPAAHKAGSSMPRPAPVGGGQQGKGAAAVERASRKHTQNRQAELMAGEHVAQSLEAMIAQMFKVARLSLQSSGSNSNATPKQRSASRTLLKCHTDLLECRAAHVQASEERQQARLDRRRAVADANTFPVPTDFLSTALRKVGRPTAQDRAAQAAQEQKRQAKEQEQQARKLRDTTREAKSKAEVAFELATADFLVQFPKQFPPAKPTAELAPTRDMAPVPPTLDQAVRPPESVSPPPPRPSLR
ncbi:MobQ family relaxase [Xanthomonas citri pv. malvacearum]|uniref:MobA/MobL protein domain-containing protein n=1 Tax=Xanthomonas campestris pv. malvacearum TaxID=86040 RepID=A0AA45BTM6_XANCM|nr:MobQ family relaxase [Xanthomonas citri]ASY83654.1 hypothetical protein CIW71_05890 [Xanthomonas citri pv. malvacearum]MCC4631509.1 MobA/MobL family protein [Xanthomonas citri]NMI15701.1 hypothetical protein [Xanthomonas citri]PUE90094.1 hypothetical protein C7T86_21990 [Xanthomonas citri pv. malvacearum]QGL19072.1 hypothetical protein GH913_21830 [Xanthomonas citri pv. malvacearum]